MLAFVLAHEMGHAVLNGDNSIHESVATNLMKAAVSEVDAIDATKRLKQTGQHDRARAQNGPGGVAGDSHLLQKK